MTSYDLIWLLIQELLASKTDEKKSEQAKRIGQSILMSGLASHSKKKKICEPHISIHK